MLIAGSGQTAAQRSRSVLAERVTALHRKSVWNPVASISVRFMTFHHQGMVKIGDTFYVSSVEVRNRDSGDGTGHLFRIDYRGQLLADLKLGEGPIYHPGGIDYDGQSIWVPVSEYRPDSRSIVFRVDPKTMKVNEVLRFADHIGAIVHNTDDDTLH